MFDPDVREISVDIVFGSLDWRLEPIAGSFQFLPFSNGLIMPGPCAIRFLYKSLNSSVRLRYPRRFLERWKETEEGIRQLLDSFIVS